MGSVTVNRICAVVVGVLVFAFAFTRAQTVDPAFDAVSIKPTTLRGFGRVEFKPGGRLTAINVSVHQLASAAYGSSWRLSIGPNCPKWIDSEKFDIEAVAEEGVIPERLDNAQLRKIMQAMLQRLLAERFKLVVRHEAKEMPIYELTVAKAGSKLTEAPISEAECRTSIDCHQVLGDRLRGLHGTAVNMADLVFALETGSGRPVVDATGLVGLFSVEVKPFADMRPELDDKLDAYLAAHPEAPRPPAEPFKPTLSSVLEKDFGLLLRPARARIETIQIESVDRPSAN